MKIKVFITLFAFIVLLFNCQNDKEQDKNSNAPVTMLKNFYSSYITEFCKNEPNEKKLNSLRNKYCTKKMLNYFENEELDYDFFLNAQDCDMEWLKTLEVKKKNKFYEVSYLDNYTKERNKIKLTVVKEKGKYKIDSVL